jgi:predicted nucleotidyltransferase
MKNIALIPYQFIEKLKKISGIKRIILYGSRARGDNEERSDIDLAIDCPGISFDEWNAIINIIEQADTLLTIDFVRFDTLSEKNPLRISIERDGLILYQKDSHE